MDARSPRLAVLLFLGAALFVLGCDSGARLPIATWTASFPDAASIEVTVPARFDRRLPQAPSRYTLASSVALPPEMQGHPLTFTVRHLPALATLWVDGEEATLLDPSTLDVYRRAGPQRWRVPARATTDGALALRLEIEHRWTQSAWLLSAPELAVSPIGGAPLAAVTAFNAAAAVGALAAAAFVVLLFGFLFVALQGRRRFAYGLFALGGASGMFYPAFALGLTQPVFGVYDAVVVAVMLTVAAIAAIHFSHAYFDLAPPHRVWKYVPFVAVGAAIAAHNPFTASHYLGPIVVVVTVLNAAFQLLLLVRLRRAPSPPRNLYLIVLAWPATAILGVPDFVAWLGAGDVVWGLRTASVGMLLICLLQATALSREHLLSLSRADDLNAELAARVALLESKRREVEVLNDDLKRQIAARSRQLAESLSADSDSGSLHDPVEALDPGDVVQERYRVVRTIGAGGMGAVYEVERVADDKHFALKVLSVMSDGAARARFAREAQAAATVNHPNVVSIIDFDVAKEGYLFLVMELVEGNTLQQVRRRHRDVPWTLYVLAQVAAGLDAVHSKGIVHRDLKPGNVLLSRGADGRRPLVKITDFGISSVIDDRASIALRAAVTPSDSEPPPISQLPPQNLQTDPTEVEIDSGQMPTLAKEPGKRTPNAPLTETGVVFGTPSYMAAELALGTKMATRSADVFSLAVIAFELFTGRRPFRESPVSANMDGHPLPVAPAFAQVCRELPAELSALLDRAIGHDPSARPTARELALALREATEKALAAR